MVFDVAQTLKVLTLGTRETKIHAYDTLAENDDHLSPLDLQLIHDALRNETDQFVKLHGLERLFWIVHGLMFRSKNDPHESTLFNLLWHKFLGSRLDSWKSAVIGICDRAHLKDVTVLLDIRGVLSRGAAPNAEFHFIPFDQWNLPSNFAALCFIGRDSFYACCPHAIRSALQGSQFKLPRHEDQMARFGAPMSPDSKIHFHHFWQTYGGYRIKYMPHESRGFRIDYGVVRRFHMPFNGRRATGLYLAGPTSLGTVGAGVFATEYSTSWPWPPNLKDPDKSDVEILLKVVARIDPDLRPWVVHEHRVIKWLPDPVWGDPEDDGGAPPPYEIPQGSIPLIVVMEGATVRDVLVGGMPPVASDAVRALLRLIFGHWHKAKASVVALSDVLADPACPTEFKKNNRAKQLQYLRDHVQRILSPAVSITNQVGEEITLNGTPCEVNWADLASSAKREVEQQTAFEEDYDNLLKQPAYSPQDLLIRYGVILGFDDSGFPTIVRLSRVE